MEIKCFLLLPYSAIDMIYFPCLQPCLSMYCKFTPPHYAHEGKQGNALHEKIQILEVMFNVLTAVAAAVYEINITE